MGLLEAHKEKDIEKLSEETAKKTLGTHVMQFYLTSNCGTISVPLGFVPTKVRIRVRELTIRG